MKTVHEDLCRVINGLEVICGTLDSLRKRIEVIPVSVDNYYKILLALKETKDIIELLGRVKEESTPKINHIKIF